MRIRMTAIACLFLFTAGMHGQWHSLQLDDSDMAKDLEEALTFQKYPTYPQYLEMMNYFAGHYPEITLLDTFGLSVQGRLLLALKISDNARLDEPEASFLYTSTIHGDELVGYPVMLRLIDFLLSNYGTDTEVKRLVDNLSIWINPLSNPDGTYYPDNDTTVVNSVRRTSEGVDLNRDFPDPSAGEADDTTGRAPETRAMMEFLRKHRFTMSANLHSGEEVVNYPWDHTYDLHADDSWYRFVSREYADEARAVDPGYMALFTDGITNGAQWYRIFGGRQDYMNYYLSGREITLELSHEYRLPSSELEEYWGKNRRSLLNYMAQCMYGIRGVVTDGSTGEPVPARIAIPGHDSAYSVVFSGEEHGDFYRLIDEGVYDLVVSSEGYRNDTIRGVTVTGYEATWLDISLEPQKSAGSVDGVSRELILYPNPFSDILYLTFTAAPAGPVRVKVYSMTGVMVHHQLIPAPGDRTGIHLNHLEPGLYLLEATCGSHSKKFLIQKL
jgi:hypothetical protein